MDKGHGNELLCQRTGVLLAEVRRCTQGSSSSAARHQAPRVGARLGACGGQSLSSRQLRRSSPVARCRAPRVHVKLAAARAELVGSHASSSPRRRLSWAWRGARGSHGPSTSGSRRWPGVELLAPWVKLVAGDVGHRTPPCALLPLPLCAAPSSAAAPLLLAPCSACALVEMRHTSLLLGPSSALPVTETLRQPSATARAPERRQTRPSPSHFTVSICLYSMLQMCVSYVLNVQEQCPKRFMLMLQNKS
jgi:hypothetical protein